jgi:uncharacterized membrane protein YraQ (UPF0718 family)
MLGCAIVLTITVALFAYSPKLAVAMVVIGIGAILTVGFLDRRFAKPRLRSRAEVAEILQEVVDGFYDELAWNAFSRYRIQDSALDKIRLRCAALEEDYPARVSGRLLSEAGEDVLREIIKELERMG